MPGIEEKHAFEQMPVMPKGAEFVEDPMTEGLQTDTDSKLAKVLNGVKLD